MLDRSKKGGITRHSLLRGGLALTLASAGAGLSNAAFAEGNASTRLPKETGGQEGGYIGGTRLILLGTAGGPPLRKFRSQPSNLLVVDGIPYMIDAGYGSLHQLLFTGHRPVDIAGLFITHHHLDHNADMVSLISFGWIEGRHSQLPIYGPYGTKHMAQASLEYFSVSERIFADETKSPRPASRYVDTNEVLKNGEFFRDRNITVTAAENTHYQDFNAGRDKSFSYRFDTPHRSIVFTGDTGYSEAVIELAKGANVLVSEVIRPNAAVKLALRDSHTAPVDIEKLKEHMWREHLPPENVGKMASKAGVKMVVLTHFAPGLDTETNAERYTAAVRQFYSGPVIAGRDLLEL